MWFCIACFCLYFKCHLVFVHEFVTLLCFSDSTFYVSCYMYLSSIMCVDGRDNIHVMRGPRLLIIVLCETIIVILSAKLKANWGVISICLRSCSSKCFRIKVSTFLIPNLDVWAHSIITLSDDSRVRCKFKTRKPGKNDQVSHENLFTELYGLGIDQWEIANVHYTVLYAEEGLYWILVKIDVEAWYLAQKRSLIRESDTFSRYWSNNYGTTYRSAMD